MAERVSGTTQTQGPSGIGGVLPLGYSPVQRKINVSCTGTLCACDNQGNVRPSLGERTASVTIEQYERRTPGSHVLFDNREGYGVGVICPFLLAAGQCGLYNPGPLPEGVVVQPPRCFRFPLVSITS